MGGRAGGMPAASRQVTSLPDGKESIAEIAGPRVDPFQPTANNNSDSASTEDAC